MNLGKTIFSQLMEFLSQYEFQKCVKRHQGNYKIKSFSCWSQFLCMSFAQLTYRESLRDIQVCLRGIQQKLYHLGFRGNISRDVMPAEEREGAQGYFMKLVNSPRPFSGLATAARDSQGRLIFVETSGVPFFDDHGQLRGFRGISRDITERKKAEEAVRKAKEDLEVRVQERTGELAQSRERLQHLASQLLLAQEKERKRVAVELHDGLLSELAAMKMLFEAKLKLLEQGTLADLNEFRKVSGILAAVIKEARRMMNNLHPSVLDELGLIAAMNWLCGEYRKSYPHIAVRRQIEVVEQDISDSLRVVIYRVLQEALNNFARHGKGDLVELSLTKTDHRFALTIRDNGQGFDMEKAQKGLGLESMRERVDVSGGEFTIESAIGRGTTIRATWVSS
jgi:signal transduction histidine kinase